jgi:preprotein translocase subunit YajC
VEIVPLLVLVLLFGLLIVLPARQRKKMQTNAAAMQAALTPGTPVMLTSGIHGTVASLGEGTVDLEIAPGVVVTVARPAVLEVRKPAGAVATEGSTRATGTADGDVDPTDRTH